MVQIPINLEELKLPTQMPILLTLSKLNEDSEESFKELEKIIHGDQTLAAFILKVANSPFYRRGSEIKTLSHAIGILGFKMIRAYALFASAKGVFEIGNYTRFRELVWRHSVVVGILARILATRKGYKKIREEAFVGGLLHDIGKVVLNAYDRSRFIQVIRKALEEKIDFTEAENAIFGFNHVDVGAKVVREWNLPEIYHPSIMHHEKPVLEGITPEEAKIILALVGVSNYMVSKAGYGHVGQKTEKDIEEALNFLQMDNKELQQYIKDTPRLLKQDEFYNFFITL